MHVDDECRRNRYQRGITTVELTLVTVVGALLTAGTFQGVSYVKQEVLLHQMKTEATMGAALVESDQAGALALERSEAGQWSELFKGESANRVAFSTDDDGSYAVLVMSSDVTDWAVVYSSEDDPVNSLERGVNMVPQHETQGMVTALSK